MSDTTLVESIISHIVEEGKFNSTKTLDNLASIINQVLDDLPLGEVDVNYLKTQINFHLYR